MGNMSVKANIDSTESETKFPGVPDSAGGWEEHASVDVKNLNFKVLKKRQGKDLCLWLIRTDGDDSPPPFLRSTVEKYINEIRAEQLVGRVLIYDTYIELSSIESSDGKHIYSMRSPRMKELIPYDELNKYAVEKTLYLM